ncbi:MAG: hypothetical protein K2N32_01655, partial [Clostridia bacterium]|nr:hypothetical protein [Clostridia bacterium]
MDIRKRRIANVSLFIIIAIFVLSAVFSCAPFDLGDSKTKENSSLFENTVLTITTNADDSLGEFNDGYSYVYTDKNLIDDYRAGDSNTPYDITSHKVAKTTINRGSQDNPYVLSTTDDWETFVKRMETDNTRGSGQYFVLGADIDFTDTVFHPVRFFNGTFYGMGHSIKNISCSEWKYYNGENLVDIASTTHGFGLFCRTSAATITDLIVENYSYREIPQTTQVESGVLRVSHSGGIVGLATGNDAILNCHSSGEITKTAGVSDWMDVSGIVGGVYTFSATDKSILIYRCSSEFYAAINGVTASQGGPQVGGILGDGYNNSKKVDAYIYDCASNVKVNTTSQYHYMGSILGHGVIGGSQYVENCVGTLDITSPTVSVDGGVLCYLPGPAHIKNCYLEGKVGANDSNKISVMAVGGITKATSAKNINVVKSTASYASSVNSNVSDSLSNISGEPQEFSSTTLLISKSKSDVGSVLLSQIWDVEKIGGKYDP